MTLPDHDHDHQHVDRYRDRVDELHARATELRDGHALSDAQWHRLEQALAEPAPPRAARVLALGDDARQVLAVAGRALAAGETLNPSSAPKHAAVLDLRPRPAGSTGLVSGPPVQVTAVMANRVETQQLRHAIVHRIGEEARTGPPPDSPRSWATVRDDDLRWAKELWYRSADGSLRARLLELFELHQAAHAWEPHAAVAEHRVRAEEMFRAIGGTAPMGDLATAAFPLWLPAQSSTTIPALSWILPLVARFEVDIAVPEHAWAGTPDLVLTVLTDPRGTTARGRHLLDGANARADTLLLIRGSGGADFPESWQAVALPPGARQRPRLVVLDVAASAAFATPSGPLSARENELNRLLETARQACADLPDNRVHPVSTRGLTTAPPRQRTPNASGPVGLTAFARRGFVALADQAGFPDLRRALAAEVAAFADGLGGAAQRDRFRRYLETLQSVLQELSDENRRPEDVADAQKVRFTHALRQLVGRVDTLTAGLATLADIERTVANPIGQRSEASYDVRVKAIRLVADWPRWRALIDAVEPSTGLISRQPALLSPLPVLTSEFVGPFEQSAADMAAHAAQVAAQVVAGWIEEANALVRDAAAELEEELRRLDAGQRLLSENLIDRGFADDVAAIARASRFAWIADLRREHPPDVADLRQLTGRLFPLAADRALPWHPQLPLSGDQARDRAQRNQITVMRMRREITNALARAGVGLLRDALAGWIELIGAELRKLRGSLPEGGQLIRVLEAAYGLRPARLMADRIDALLDEVKASVAQE